jgi:hypothetical protein
MPNPITIDADCRDRIAIMIKGVHDVGSGDATHVVLGGLASKENHQVNRGVGSDCHHENGSSQ